MHCFMYSVIEAKYIFGRMRGIRTRQATTLLHIIISGPSVLHPAWNPIVNEWDDVSQKRN